MFIKQSFLLIMFIASIILQQVQCQPAVLPTHEQVAWANAEVGVIIHLDINIYAPATFNYEDSKTLPDVSAFNPTKLNTDQWIRTAKAAGAKYAVLTVKHGTGFCLWPSKVNNYNVGHTKWRKGKCDILQEFVASCKKYGMKPGLYYNTNSNTFYNAGYRPFANDSLHAVYNKAVLAQLKEIWNNYGKMFEIWFDGGITSGKDGIKGEVMQMINTCQPQAILFQGPVNTKNIIRWIGNEDGIAAYPQWSRAEVTTASNGSEKIDDLHGNPNGKIWCPGESDFPIMNNNAWNGGWLWKANEESYLFTLAQLTDKYYKSVGRNSNMLIGMVVDTSGLVPKQDSIVYDSLGRNIKRLFASPVALLKNSSKTITTITIPANQIINQVVMSEDQRQGERIRAYTIETYLSGKWIKIAEGQSIGHKRIQTFSPVLTNKIRLKINEQTATVKLKQIAFYNNDYSILNN